MASPLPRLRRALGALIPKRADWRAMGWRGIAGALLSAALMRLAFPKFDLGWLAWVGLVPIFLTTRDREPRAAKWLWYLFAVAWFYTSLTWFNATSYVNVLIYPAVVLMALVLGLYVLLFAWAATWLRRLGPTSLFLIPAAWVATEYLRTFTEFAFPWLYLAHTHHRFPALIQSASVFGTHGLSFLIVMGNLLIAEGIALAWTRGRPWRALAVATAIWAALMIANALLGIRAVERWSAPSGSDPVRIAIIQQNWDQRLKFEERGTFAGTERLFRDVLDQVQQLEPADADLVLLPEMVVLDLVFPLEARAHIAILAAEAQRLGAVIVFGANNATVPPGRDARILADLQFHNSVWAMGPNGEFRGVYDKLHLVAFSESAPILRWFPGLTRTLLGPLILLTPGEEVVNLPVGTAGREVALGAHVCFESTFPDLVRRFTLEGANILATITNDAWFLESAGPDQHWVVQPFRAVENRRWIAQSAQTGISSLVGPAGVVAVSTRVGERMALIADAEPRTEITLYARHGDWFAQLCLALCALALAGAIIRRRRPSESPEDTPR